jgi:hypothetical protein
MHRSLLVLALCLVTVIGAAWGQGQSGTLNGTVVDKTGAVVSGSAVNVKNIATGVEQKTTTTAAGAYTFPYLPAGTYNILVTAPGFKASDADNIILRVAQTLTINMTLEVGQLSEQVTVSSTPELLDTGSAEIGRYISTEEYKAWPILISDGQRQIQEFIFDSLPGTTGNTFQGSINGGQQYSHEILIDGIPVGRSDLSGGNTEEFSPSAEAIGEFKLQEGAVGAQYNGGQTAVANYSIKSGTNELHGTGFWYLQNESLNAMSMGDKMTGNTKPSKFRENNEGYSLGGPVYVSKLYKGKNRTFFFTNYEKTHYNDLVINGLTQVIPNEYRAGDFSGLLNPAWTGNAQSGTQVGTDALGRPILLGQIYDPATTRIVNGREVRDPFPGNIIPQDRINSVTKSIFDPSVTGGVVAPTYDTMVKNIAQVGSCCPYFDLHIIGVKVDHNISDKHHFSAYYNQSYRNILHGGGTRYLPAPGPVTTSWQNQAEPGRMVRASLSSTLSPRIVNRVAAGYNRFVVDAGAPPSTIGQNWAGKIGVQNTSDGWFPDMNFSGNQWQGGSYGKLGVGYYGGSANGSRAFTDDLTYMRGAHSIHLGYQYMNYYYNERNYNSSGDFYFSPRSTGEPGYLADTGNSVAGFLLGAVNSASRGIYTLSDGERQPYHAFYASDDWKITPRLTMNYGLRWEIIPPFFERTGRLSYIDVNAPNPDAGGIHGALVFGKQPNSTYWRELGPRLGFAYQLNNKTVVRAGYAMMNTPPIANNWGYGGFTYGYNGSINVRQGRSSTGFVEDPAMYLNQPFPNYAGTPLPNTDPSSGNFDASTTSAPDANRPGYTQNWNFTVQYKLPKDTVVEAAYIGNKGTRLYAAPFSQLNGNPASLLSMGDTLLDPVSAHPQYLPFANFPTDYSVAQALRKYPQYFSINEFFPYNANSLYNSLQITVTKHLTTGLGFLAAYTWSKTLGTSDSNGPQSGYNGYSSSPQDFYNRKLERSVTTFNLPQNFKLTWSYETPFGKGRRWNLHAFNYVLGGWQLAAIHNYLSGAAVSVSSSGLTIPDGFAGGIRPDLLSGNMTVRGVPSHVDYFNPTPYLNTAAFANVPTTANGVPLRVGTAPRVIDGLRGPDQLGETFRMSKKFYFTEKRFVGVGMTMTNPFNRHSPYVADTTVGDSNFGQLQEGGGGRILQLDARIEF